MLRYLLPILLVCVSCSTKSSSVLDEHALFRLPFGRLEGQLSYVSEGNSYYQFRNQIAMQKGFVYLVNGQSYKVMVFNSFGDLIRLLYNPDHNPHPVLLAPYTEDRQLATRVAIAYEFENVSDVVVASDGTQFVVNRLHPDRTVFDEASNIYLAHVVVRISAEGEILDYLGQEGVGGTPFPYVESLWITGRQEVVVISKTTESWSVYLFNEDGELRYQVFIPFDRLPVPEALAVLPMVERIVPGNAQAALYIKMHYLQELFDEETQERSAINYFGSRIYTLDLESSQYTGFIDATFDAAEGGDYEFVGMSQNDEFFLVRTGRDTPGTLDLIIVDRRGKILRRRTLVTGDIFDRVLRVNSDNSMIALLVRSEYADVVWWRTDALLKEL